MQFGTSVTGDSHQPESHQPEGHQPPVHQPPIHQPPSHQEDDEALMQFGTSVTEDSHQEDAVGDFADLFVNLQQGDKAPGDVDPHHAFVLDLNSVPAEW